MGRANGKKEEKRKGWMEKKKEEAAKLQRGLTRKKSKQRMRERL